MSHIFNLFYRTGIQDPSLSGVSVSSTSEIRTIIETV
jgi:hypothetical protein